MARPTILLIHGGCHRGDCWHRLVPALQALGREAIAIDLPGYGRDPHEPPTDLNHAIAATVAAIRNIDGPVILVGHSLGGLSVSAAAEQVPDRIAHLVYLTAVVPRDGDSAAAFQELPGFNGSTGSEMLDDNIRVRVKPDLAHDLFYADCDDAVALAAVAALVTTDIGHLGTPVSLSPERFGRVAKTYIICLKDKAIEPRAQRVMAAVHPETALLEIDGSHSAYLSRPDELAAMLDAL